MPRRSVRLQTQRSEAFADGMREIERELQVPLEFPPEVMAEVAKATADPGLPERDETDLALVTIDPTGSMDLDQAVAISRRGTGYRVHYAIADVAAFVTPAGAIDTEAHHRGETLYAPGQRFPLYPSELSEGAASLLPAQVRPALLWTIDLDSTGEGTRVDVARARVKSHGKFDYEAVQRSLVAGSADDVFVLLREVGRLRLQREAGRGGVSLPLPEQEVVVEDSRWSLRYRTMLDVEQWNAQISLLTGMACAEIMLYGEVGIVRTLPQPTHQAVSRLRRTAAALRLPWPAELDYPGFVRSIDPNSPSGAAMLNACTRLLRGAGYVAFEGGVPEHIEHAALASEYAHTTAPLRRLVDRYAGEIAVALCADTPVPDWVRRRLREIPKIMDSAERRSHQFEGAVVSLVEAGLLAHRVGESFDGVVTEVDDHQPTNGVVMLTDPAVEARVSSPERALPLGERITVRLTEADVTRRLVRFEPAG